MSANRAGQRQYFNEEIEPILNTPAVRKIQQSRLQTTLRYIYDNVPFDRARMDTWGILSADIRSFDEYARALPLCGQADFRAVFEQVGNDMFRAYDILFGAERMKDLHLLTTTSGTTGIPTPYPVFHKSAEAMGEIMGRMGGVPACVRGIGWPLDLASACMLGERHNCIGTRRSAAWPLFPLARKPAPNVSCKWSNCSRPMYSPVRRLWRFTSSSAVRTISNQPIRNLGIRKLILGAEPGAGIPEVRMRLEREYGARVFDLGAGYGVSCDCAEYQGMHWVADDYCYYELVNPETHEPVAMEHGAIGLAAFTPLEPESAIFFANLRISLNDIHQVFTEPCPCGNSGFRYKIVGRVDDMLKVKGVPVYPVAIQGVINGFVPRVTGAFRIVLDEPPPRVVPPLKLRVEFGGDIQEHELPLLERELVDKMHSLLKIRPAIAWIKPLTLERAVKKTQLLEKSYEKR